MTISVGIRFKNHFILASDGCVSNDDTILFSDFNKIYKFQNYVFNISGTASGATLMKKVLFDIDKNKKPVPLAYRLLDYKLEMPETKEDPIETDYILLELSKGQVVSALDVSLSGNHISALDLLDTNMKLAAIGCGKDHFLASFKTLAEASTLAEMKYNVTRAMEVTAEVNAYCNKNITMKTYRIK